VPTQIRIYGPTFNDSLNQGEAKEGNSIQETNLPTKKMSSDKNRKVLRLLEPGDVIHEVYNITRINGLDTCGKYINNI
jgi:hypothetical protein